MAGDFVRVPFLAAGTAEHAAGADKVYVWPARPETPRRPVVETVLGVSGIVPRFGVDFTKVHHGKVWL